MSQLSGSGGTFLCDHFIQHNVNKPLISNVILLGFFAFSCIFVFLFDEKLMRQEVDKAGREKEDAKEGEKKNEAVIIEIAKN